MRGYAWTLSLFVVLLCQSFSPVNSFFFSPFFRSRSSSSSSPPPPVSSRDHKVGNGQIRDQIAAEQNQQQQQYHYQQQQQQQYGSPGLRVANRPGPPPPSHRSPNPNVSYGPVVPPQSFHIPKALCIACEKFPWTPVAGENIPPSAPQQQQPQAPRASALGQTAPAQSQSYGGNVPVPAQVQGSRRPFAIQFDSSQTKNNVVEGNQNQNNPPPSPPSAPSAPSASAPASQVPTEYGLPNSDSSRPPTVLQPVSHSVPASGPAQAPVQAYHPTSRPAQFYQSPQQQQQHGQFPPVPSSSYQSGNFRPPPPPHFHQQQQHQQRPTLLQPSKHPAFGPAFYLESISPTKEPIIFTTPSPSPVPVPVQSQPQQQVPASGPSQTFNYNLQLTQPPSGYPFAPQGQNQGQQKLPGPPAPLTVGSIVAAQQNQHQHQFTQQHVNRQKEVQHNSGFRFSVPPPPRQQQQGYQQQQGGQQPNSGFQFQNAQPAQLIYQEHTQTNGKVQNQNQNQYGPPPPRPPQQQPQQKPQNFKVPIVSQQQHQTPFGTLKINPVPLESVPRFPPQQQQQNQNRPFFSFRPQQQQYQNQQNQQQPQFQFQQYGPPPQQNQQQFFGPRPNHQHQRPHPPQFAPNFGQNNGGYNNGPAIFIIPKQPQLSLEMQAPPPPQGYAPLPSNNIQQEQQRPIAGQVFFPNSQQSQQQQNQQQQQQAITTTGPEEVKPTPEQEQSQPQQEVQTAQTGPGEKPQAPISIPYLLQIEPETRVPEQALGQNLGPGQSHIQIEVPNGGYAQQPNKYPRIVPIPVPTYIDTESEVSQASNVDFVPSPLKHKFSPPVIVVKQQQQQQQQRTQSQSQGKEQQQLSNQNNPFLQSTGPSGNSVDQADDQKGQEEGQRQQDEQQSQSQGQGQEQQQQNQQQNQQQVQQGQNGQVIQGNGGRTFIRAGDGKGGWEIIPATQYDITHLFKNTPPGQLPDPLPIPVPIPVPSSPQPNKPLFIVSEIHRDRGQQRGQSQVQQQQQGDKPLITETTNQIDQFGPPGESLRQEGQRQQQAQEQQKQQQFQQQQFQQGFTPVAHPRPFPVRIPIVQATQAQQQSTQFDPLPPSIVTALHHAQRTNFLTHSHLSQPHVSLNGVKQPGTVYVHSVPVSAPGPISGPAPATGPGTAPAQTLDEEGRGSNRVENVKSIDLQTSNCNGNFQSVVPSVPFGQKLQPQFRPAPTKQNPFLFYYPTPGQQSSVYWVEQPQRQFSPQLPGAASSFAQGSFSTVSPSQAIRFGPSYAATSVSGSVLNEPVFSPPIFGWAPKIVQTSNALAPEQGQEQGQGPSGIDQQQAVLQQISSSQETSSEGEEDRERGNVPQEEDGSRQPFDIISVGKEPGLDDEKVQSLEHLDVDVTTSASPTTTTGIFSGESTTLPSQYQFRPGPSGTGTISVPAPAESFRVSEVKDLDGFTREFKPSKIHAQHRPKSPKIVDDGSSPRDKIITYTEIQGPTTTADCITEVTTELPAYSSTAAATGQVQTGQTDETLASTIPTTFTTGAGVGSANRVKNGEKIRLRVGARFPAGRPSITPTTSTPSVPTATATVPVYRPGTSTSSSPSITSTARASTSTSTATSSIVETTATSLPPVNLLTLEDIYKSSEMKQAQESSKQKITASSSAPSTEKSSSFSVSMDSSSSISSSSSSSSSSSAGSGSGSVSAPVPVPAFGDRERTSPRKLYSPDEVTALGSDQYVIQSLDRGTTPLSISGRFRPIRPTQTETVDIDSGSPTASPSPTMATSTKVVKTVRVRQRMRQGGGPIRSRFPGRVRVVQRPVTQEYIKSFPEYAQPEGEALGKEEQEEVKNALIDLKKISS